MELLIVLAILATIAVLALIGFGVDSRDNENWNPGGIARPR
jgi:Tfp pilus assembly protein FimT